MQQCRFRQGFGDTQSSQLKADTANLFGGSSYTANEADAGDARGHFSQSQFILLNRLTRENHRFGLLLALHGELRPEHLEE